MKKLILLFVLFLVIGAQAQRTKYHRPKHKENWRTVTSVTAKDVTLTYDRKHNSLNITMPPNGLDTGNPKIIKSIEVYKNYLLLMQQKNQKYPDTLNGPVTSLRGFCSANRHPRGWDMSTSPVGPGEYLLIVKIYYLDKSIGVWEESLIVN
jgi:hypothetical protein